jgi:hypothetical protein
MRWTWIVLAMAVGCDKDPAEEGEDDTDTPAETEETDTPSDTEETDTEEEPTTGQIQLVVSDFLTGAAVDGATVTAMDQTAETDAAGEALFNLPPGDRFAMEVTAEGVVPIRFEHGPVTAGLAQRTSAQVVSEDTLTLLSGGLGIPIDPSKGHLIVQISGVVVDDNKFDSEDGIVGASVSISANASVSLVEDANPLGFAPGNTVALAGARGIVVFVNVDPGEVTLTRTLPGGETCGLTYGVITGAVYDDVQVRAGAFTNAAYYCY